ncbi:MAG: hypothetical protein GX218_02340, partial [Clostridiaceae bacterium]|nr:hypothetical protein [Clostridiaceae bacterium]
MGLFGRLKRKEIKGIDDSEYLTLREERRIARENNRIIRRFEREKARRNVSESEYLTTMRDP